MRIALLAPFGLQPKGTTSARVLPIAQVLAGQGAEVRVIIPPWDDPRRANQRWRQAGYEVVHTGVGPGRASPLVATAEMLDCVRDWRPDVVHAFKPIGCSGAVAWLLARRPRSGVFRGPLVVVDADDLEGPAGWASRRGQRMSGRIRGIQERMTLRRAHRVTAASQWLQRYAARIGVAETDILYLPNGQAGPAHPTPSAPGAPGQTPRLLWYTRFTEADPARVAALLGPLFAELPALRLSVVGEEIGAGDEAAAQRAFARAGLSDRVDWRGYPADVDAELERFAQAGAAIYPLDDDRVNRARCPAKIPQLMARGIPVVAERVGEAGAYLAGLEESGLAEPGDPDGFRDRARRLVTDSEARARVAAATRIAADRWTWATTAGSLLGFYQEALNHVSQKSSYKEKA